MRAKRRCAALGPHLIGIARRAEQRRLRPLERKDRLLGVAHREQRARPLGGAVAGEELVGQRVDHLPLLRIGVLALVDQDMGDAGIELVAHPGALSPVAEQGGGARDQVVEIEPGAGALQPFVVGSDGGEHVDQRLGAQHQFGAGDFRLERHKARLFARQQVEKLGNVSGPPAQPSSLARALPLEPKRTPVRVPRLSARPDRRRRLR